MPESDTPQPDDAAPKAARPSRWIERNYRWAMPVGCGILLVLGLAVMLGIYAINFARFRQTEPLAGAVRLVNGMPAVAAVLGRPAKPGWYFEGVINHGAGKADFSFPVSAPGGKATVEVEARLENQRWIYDRIVVKVKGSGQAFTRDADEANMPERPSGKPSTEPDP